MRLVAVSFIVPVRFHGDRIDICREVDGWAIEPHAEDVKVSKGGKAIVVPASNCVGEYEVAEVAPDASPAPERAPAAEVITDVLKKRGPSRPKKELTP